MRKILAFDVGGTFIKYGVVQENAKIIENGKLKTPKTLEALLDAFEELSQQYTEVDGIAVSCPGAVSNEGVIYGSSAIPFIHGPNMKQLISERTGLPVYMENDANCAGYAEVWEGSAKGKQDVLVMVIGTGIGGAVIKDGVLHKGKNLHGGEFGYMLLTSDYKSSDDVWSRVASTKALVKKVAKAKNIDIDSISGEEIFEMAETRDPICEEAVDQFYQLLAIGIYNLQYIYDPEVILIGGGVSARDDLIDKINGKMDHLLEVVNLAKVRPVIDTCKFRQDANLLGAVYGFIKQYTV